MNTAITTSTRAQLNLTPISTRPLTSRLTYREKELLCLLRAGGQQWTTEMECARTTLKFEVAFARLRAAGVPIQRFTRIDGLRLYRIAKPAPPPPPPAVNPMKLVLQPVQPRNFILSPMTRQKFGRPS